ncbi:MAG: nuclear transport factor 2 family protein [Halopseudomonas sp.]
MSTQANIELIQQFYGAIGAGNIETILSYVSDEIEIINPLPEQVPFGGTYQGKDGLLNYLGQLAQSIEMGLEIDNLVANDNTVVVVGVENSSTKATGRSYRMPYVHVLTIVDGKISRFDEYNQYHELAAAFAE